MADFLVNWLASTPAFAVPYAIAALGLIVSEKAGVLALGAEGFMLVGAMAGVGAVVVMGGHPLLGLFDRSARRGRRRPDLRAAWRSACASTR